MRLLPALPSPVRNRRIRGCPPASRRLSAFLLTLLPTVAAPLAVSAATYHVAPPPAGSDANPGSQAQPWATLQHAADTVSAGDTVLVGTGDYAGAYLTTSGTALLPITFRAAPGASPRVVSDNAITPDGINIEAADHVVIEGFRVQGTTRAGIRAVLCDRVTIRGNDTDQNGRWGIFTGFCDDLLIENNTTSRSVIEHGIYVSNSGDRPVIRGNLIFDNNANGIHMNGDRFAGGDGVISDALVENNIIFGNGEGGGSGINCDGVETSLIRNNLIYDTHASGISLYQIDGGAPSTGNRVFNNTVIVASDGRWALNIQNGSTGNTVRNNIFYSEHGFRGAMSVCSTCLPGFTSNHNVVEDRFTLDDGNTVLTLSQWRTQTGQDSDSRISDPASLFENPSVGDYHLKQGSPALDMGETLADVPTDLEGTPRPVGPAYDAGAYEGVGLVFTDGFEAGNVLAWSSSAP